MGKVFEDYEGETTMTEDDKSFLKEFLRSAGMIGIIVGVFILIIALTIKQNPPVESQSAKVVDTYKGCDIVRWTNHQFAEYKYFLHCENNK